MGTCNRHERPEDQPGLQPHVDCPNVYGTRSAQGPGPNTIALTAIAAISRGFGISAAGTRPVVPDLKGAYTQQFGGGIQYEVLQDLTLGVEYLGRRLGKVIEDMSSDDGGNYFIANPTVVEALDGHDRSAYAGHHLNPINAVGLSGHGRPPTSSPGRSRSATTTASASR